MWVKGPVMGGETARVYESKEWSLPVVPALPL